MSAVITFSSTHDAMRAEKLLSQAGLGAVVMPVPRALSASCGFALRVNLTALEPARRLLDEAGIERRAFTGDDDQWREVSAT